MILMLLERKRPNLGCFTDLKLLRLKAFAEIVHKSHRNVVFRLWWIPMPLLLMLLLLVSVVGCLAAHHHGGAVESGETSRMPFLASRDEEVARCFSFFMDQAWCWGMQRNRTRARQLWFGGMTSPKFSGTQNAGFPEPYFRLFFWGWVFPLQKPYPYSLYRSVPPI